MVKCGNCKSSHESAADVRRCFEVSQSSGQKPPANRPSLATPSTAKPPVSADKPRALRSRTPAPKEPKRAGSASAAKPTARRTNPPTPRREPASVVRLSNRLLDEKKKQKAKFRCEGCSREFVAPGLPWPVCQRCKSDEQVRAVCRVCEEMIPTRTMGRCRPCIRKAEEIRESFTNDAAVWRNTGKHGRGT